MAREPIGVGDDSRLPRRVREQLAAEVADDSTEVGAAVVDTIAGSVGALNDPAVAGLIDDTESDTRDRLNATIETVGANKVSTPETPLNLAVKGIAEEEGAARYVTRDSVFIGAQQFLPLQGSATLASVGSGSYIPRITIAAGAAQSYLGAPIDVRQIDGWETAHIDLLWTIGGTAGGDVLVRGNIFSLNEGGDPYALLSAGALTARDAGTTADVVLRTRIKTSQAVQPNLFNWVRIDTNRALAEDTATDAMHVLGVILVRAS